MTDKPTGTPNPNAVREAESREDLFDLLKFDLATPDEAEAEAARRGWAPLAPQPDPSKFDPMAEQQWTLPMAMAWIASRSAHVVRMSWNKYRLDYPYWRHTDWRNGPGGQIFKGWLLEHLRPATSLGLELLAIERNLEHQDPPDVMTVKEARDALWEALAEGLLPATGLARLGGGRVTIAPEQWHSLRPLYSNHRDEVGRDGVGLDFAEPWVPARAVLHLWPARRTHSALPPLMKPEGDGFMPLYCAARWIASRGGAFEFDAEDETIWQQAYAELLAAISSDKVRVVGLHGGERDLIPGHKFAGCLVDYPHTEAPMDLLMSNDVYLRSYPYLDDLHWRNGFDDALVNRQGALWTQLMADKRQVREHWPFELALPAQTGMPGRPTSKHLIMSELERRFAEGEMLPSVTEEAKALWDWLKVTHPLNPPGTAKTIENQIRDRHRELRAPK